jgi:hypothetical protein
MKYRATVLLACLFLLLSAEAGADEFLGVMAGPSIVNQGVGLRADFGFETAGKLDPHWSVGFLVNFESLGTTLSSSTDSTTLTTFMGSVTYHGWENNRGPWAGVRAGIGVLNNAGTIAGAGSVGGSANEAAYGVGVGYDTQLGSSKEWTWGPQGQAFIISAPGGSIEVFNILVSIRYWPE